MVVSGGSNHYFCIEGIAMIEAFRELLMWIWEWVLCITLKLLSFLLTLIPVPESIVNGISVGFDNSNSLLSYMSGFLELDFAVAVFFAAAITRFVIRRIPLFG